MEGLLMGVAAACIARDVTEAESMKVWHLLKNQAPPYTVSDAYSDVTCAIDRVIRERDAA